ncbi:MAG: HD domain-containing protein [Phycisphaerales bacterium]|nr:HD domain-containing protein [Phycisphaerales bacterium]
MLRIELARVKEGMELASAVMHPRTPGRLLLRPGYRLDSAAIGRMRDLGIPTLWVKFPSLADVIKRPSQVLSAQQDAVLARLSECFDHSGHECFPEIPYAEFAGAVRSLVERIRLEPFAASMVSEMASSPGSLGEHCGATAFLSVVLGLKLEGYLLGQRKRVSGIAAKHVESLGLGALLHDVGLLTLPPSMRGLRDGDPGSEQARWRDHPHAGWSMVHAHIEPTAAAVVLHHHQRYDGAGFPAISHSDGFERPPSGSDIHVFSRIVSVADRFDEARRAKPPSSGCLATVEALRQVVDAARANVVDPVVVKALTHVIPAFTPGSIVELSTGQPAVVLEHNPLKPCRPLVQHVRTFEIPAELDEDFLGERIDLATSDDVHVCHADGRDVSGAIFDPLCADEFDVRVLEPPARGSTPRKRVA